MTSLSELIASANPSGLIDEILESVTDSDSIAELERKRKTLQERREYLYERWKAFNLFVVECLEWEAPWFHEDMDNYGMVLAPRGHGKSWRRNVGKVAHRLAYHPDIRGLIISEAKGTAQLFLNHIKGIIDYNPLYRFVYGDLNGERMGYKWNQDEITIATRRKVLLEPTLMVLAVETAIVGRHFDFIICDDIISDKNQSTQQQRDKVRRWWSVSLKPCLEPDNIYGLDHPLMINGTRYHPEDLYHFLMLGEFRNDFKVYKAINTDGDGNEYALWESKFPLGDGERDEDCDPRSTLRGIRYANGTAFFELQFQNNAALMTGQIYKIDWLKQVTYEEYEAKLAHHSSNFEIQTVDLTTKEKENNDFFAQLCITEFPDKTWWVHDGSHFRGSIGKQCRAIKQKYDEHQPLEVAIESVAFMAIVPELSDDLEDVPTVGLDTKKSKEFRARRAAIPCEQGRVYFVTEHPMLQKLVNNLILYPELDYDDDCDAFFMLFDRRNHSTTPNVKILTSGMTGKRTYNVPNKDLMTMSVIGRRIASPPKNKKKKGKVVVKHA